MMSKTVAMSSMTVCLFLLLTAGCAPGPQAPWPYADMTKSAPVGPVSAVTPEIARIHLHRPSAFLGITSTTPIHFNGSRVGKMTSGSSLDRFVTPGHLQIRGSYRIRPLDLVVKGGHEYRLNLILKENRFAIVSDVRVAASAEPVPPPLDWEDPGAGTWGEIEPGRSDPPVVRTKETPTAADQTPARTLPTRTGTEELRGKVVGVDGRSVRIAMESEMLPKVGDTVGLGQSMAGFDELIFMAGEWTVTGIAANQVSAEAGAGVSGTPGRGYVAVFPPVDP
jgi:hypothetical protein